MAASSKQVSVSYDPHAKTITVWFGPQTDSYDTVKIDDDCLLMKLKSGETVGIVRLNYSLAEGEQLQFGFETVRY